MNRSDYCGGMTVGNGAASRQHHVFSQPAWPWQTQTGGNHRYIRPSHIHRINQSYMPLSQFQQIPLVSPPIGSAAHVYHGQTSGHVSTSTCQWPRIGGELVTLPPRKIKFQPKDGGSLAVQDPGGEVRLHLHYCKWSSAMSDPVGR